MDAITQGVLGAAAAQLVLQRYVGPRAWLYGAIGGMAPDLDSLIRSGADPLLTLRFHRHFTHSLAFIPIGGPLSALPWLVRKRHRANWRRIVAATTVGYATHALLDALTTYGTMLWWPFSDARVALSWVAIVDPLVTIPLAIGVWSTARRDRLRPAALAMAWALAYLVVGGIQRARAVAAAEALAQARGHAIERVDAFPLIPANVVWRTAYVSGGRIHVDWVRVPWFSGVQPHEGESIALATEDSLPQAVRGDPRTLAAWRTFSWFSIGWIAPDPEVPGAYGDMRYGVDIGGVASMWAVQLRPGESDAVGWAARTDRMRERIDDLLAVTFGLQP